MAKALRTHVIPTTMYEMVVVRLSPDIHVDEQRLMMIEISTIWKRKIHGAGKEKQGGKNVVLCSLSGHIVFGFLMPGFLFFIE